MAFTDYNFDVPNPQRSAIQVQNRESPITGILAGVDQAAGAYQAKRSNDRIDAETANQDGLNDIATRTFNTDVQNNNGVPASVRTAVAGLDSTKAGVEQGRLPPAAYSVQLQKNVTDAINQNPGAAAKIMEYMRTSGHDHPMFQALDDQIQSQDALRKSLYIARDTAIQFAYANDVPLSTPPDQAAQRGNELMIAKAKQAQAATDARTAAELATADAEQAKIIKAKADTLGLQGVQEEIASRTTGVYQSVQQLTTMAMTDPAKVQQMQTTILPLIDNLGIAAKTSAHNHLISMGLGTPENFKSVDEQVDSVSNGMRTIFTDQTGGLQRTVQNLENTYHLQVAQIAPTIYKLGALIGNNQVAGLLGAQSTLDPELQKQLAKEWQGVASGADGQIHLNNIVSILKGNKNLQDFSEADAHKYIGGIVSAQKSAELTIITSGGVNVDHNVYLNATSNVINAAHALTPASDGKDLVTATRLVASQGTRQALDKMAANPETREQAEAVGMASHVAARKLLQDFQTGSSQSTFGGLPVGNRYQTITFDPSKGIFVAGFDRAAFDKDHGDKSSTGKAQTASQLAKFQSAAIYGPLKDRVDAMNMALDHAVKTTKYDTDVPKSVTPLQLRRAFATNTPLPTNTARGGADVNDLWSKAEANLETTLRQAPTAFMMQDLKRDQQQGSNTDNMKPADKPVNNPGNLRKSPTSFQQFGSLNEGIMAADHNLQLYPSHHNVKTLADAINTWAPPSDHNDTEGYIKQVAKETGLDPHEPLDFHNPMVRATVLAAIFKREGTPGITAGQIYKLTRGGVASTEAPASQPKS